MQEVSVNSPVKPEAREEAKEIDLGFIGEPYGETNIGRKRLNNEDALLIGDLFDHKVPTRIFAVCDGVGGVNKGEVAAKGTIVALNKLANGGHKITPQDLVGISRRLEAGATTLVLAQAFGDGNSFDLFSAGDSSALVVDMADRSLREVTIRDENAAGKITQALGPEAGKRGGVLKPNHVVVHLQENQTLLLVTDGFMKYMDNGKLKPANIFTLRHRFPDNKAFVEQLIKLANVSGGSDNITVLAVPYHKIKI